VNLGPCFDEPLLGPRQTATDALDGVDRERGGGILVVRMKVWPMVRRTGSTNIRMTIPKNREISGI